MYVSAEPAIQVSRWGDVSGWMTCWSSRQVRVTDNQRFVSRSDDVTGYVEASNACARLKCTQLFSALQLLTSSTQQYVIRGEVNVVPYLIQALEAELIQSVGSQVAGDVRLSLLSAGPTVTFPTIEHHCCLPSTRLYCLLTEAHVCHIQWMRKYWWNILKAQWK